MRNDIDYYSNLCSYRDSVTRLKHKTNYLISGRDIPQIMNI